MNRQEAIEALKQDPMLDVRFSTRSGDLDHFVHVSVYLDEDGELVYPHPTDPRRGPVRAPDKIPYFRVGQVSAVE